MTALQSRWSPFWRITTWNYWSAWNNWNPLQAVLLALYGYGCTAILIP
jgi:hypothetical protein